MPECLIAFGANLASPKVTFELAFALLCARGFRPARRSGLWRSPAWPAGSGQPDYINAVISGQYDGEPEKLMDELLSIETELGRKRSVANAARTLDLDLLSFGHVKCQTDHLTLPHPRMLERAFVLVPASEVDEKWLRHLRCLPEKDVRETRYVGGW